MTRAISKAIFVGAKIKAANDANMFIMPPKVGGQYKKEASIQEELQRLQSERMREATMPPRAYDDNPYHRPITGVLTAAYAMNREGQVLFQQETTKPGERGMVAVPFINFLLDEFRGQFADSVAQGDAATQTLIFGFDIKEILRIAAFEALGRNSRLPAGERMHVPVRLWYNPLGVYDPVDVLLNATHKKDLDLGSLTRYFGINTGDGVGTVQGQARCVAALVEAAQLVTQLVDEE